MERMSPNGGQWRTLQVIRLLTIMFGAIFLVSAAPQQMVWLQCHYNVNPTLGHPPSWASDPGNVIYVVDIKADQVYDYNSSEATLNRLTLCSRVPRDIFRENTMECFIILDEYIDIEYAYRDVEIDRRSLRVKFVAGSGNRKFFGGDSTSVWASEGSGACKKVPPMPVRERQF